MKAVKQEPNKTRLDNLEMKLTSTQSQVEQVVEQLEEVRLLLTKFGEGMEAKLDQLERILTRRN